MGDITIGQILVAVGLLDALGAIWFGLRWARYRSEMRGTPLYARARDARRLTIVMAISAILLVAVGALTPLCGMRLA